MEETLKENTTGFGCETEHVGENSDNGNDEQSDDGNEQIDDENGKHCDKNNKNDVNSAENSYRFTEVDSSIDLLTKQFENPLLNTDVQISSLKMEYECLQDYVKNRPTKPKIRIILPSRESYFVWTLLE